MAFSFWHSHHDEPAIEVPAIGLELRVTLPMSATDNALTLIEALNRPGFGPPKHRHRETEVFRVLSGRYLFEVDGARFIAETGDVVTAPGGAAHAFVNIADQPARQLVMIVPGLDAVAFFTQLGATMKDGAPDPAALKVFGAKWGVEFLGPPLKKE